MTAVSAPGKVLLTGGYLVLDRNYTGTVFALDARIHAIVQQLRRRSRQLSASPFDAVREGAEQQAGGSVIVNDTSIEEETITVRSPQFLDAVWEYKLKRYEDGGGVKVVQHAGG